MHPKKNKLIASFFNLVFSSANRDNRRNSVMSDDAVPSNSNQIDPEAYSSSDDSPSDFPEDSFEEGEPTDADSTKQATLHTTVINEMKEKGLFEHLESIKENQKAHYVNGFLEDESVSLCYWYIH